MNWNDVKKIIRREVLKEATTVNAGNTRFNLRTGVNKNPTKLGIKIQFEPLGDGLETDIKSKLEVALQEKLNISLQQYDIQVSKDTDVPRPEVIGFLNEISKVVKKDDFYEFINKGNNILRDLEGAGMPNGKKYLVYLVKHNIM